MNSSLRGTGQWIYTQDLRGQVLSGQRSLAGGGTLPPEMHYAYDNIGNRTNVTAVTSVSGINDGALQGAASGIVVGIFICADTPRILMLGPWE
ncbi:MAG: hypothetical protein KDK99_18170 [Verrucomicrobiales bacterium]|nr:hypothetical protein [Verrucomicrobiales bacterium]